MINLLRCPAEYWRPCLFQVAVCQFIPKALSPSSKLVEFERLFGGFRFDFCWCEYRAPSAALHQNLVGLEAVDMMRRIVLVVVCRLRDYPAVLVSPNNFRRDVLTTAVESTVHPNPERGPVIITNASRWSLRRHATLSNHKVFISRPELGCFGSLID